jgi:general transcription factor 3C polypeptide 5 (transcription factor C subunit 1)
MRKKIKRCLVYVGMMVMIHILLVAYAFRDGSWMDTFIRFGYDPRKDIDACLSLSNMCHIRSCLRHSQGTQPSTPVSPECSTCISGSRFSHIPDGVRLHTETEAFQLCGIYGVEADGRVFE